MSKWTAYCTLDCGDTIFPVEVEANTYTSAYVEAMCKLPPEVRAGTNPNGIIDLVPNLPSEN